MTDETDASQATDGEDYGVPKTPAFGTYGEFFVGAGETQIRAQYLMTKIRPGQGGLWENQLASKMAPWREIFKIEDMAFDELIQRDLDDSRVAHDLIPYLLGETGQQARFFPPVLAVLVPKKIGPSGISPRYPIPTTQGQRISFGDLFDFEKKIEKKSNGSQVSPHGTIKYNPDNSAFVLVDGQHRAMAILALHRQINNSWGDNPYAPYYSHIQVDATTVAHLELPVCIIFFPDLHEGRPEFQDKGVDLISVCREIFIVVNRQAKQVSKSRELLLDDEDFAAFMMRRTLTRFKDRKDVPTTAARIYAFDFGDSEAENGGHVLAGKLELCSAVALHRMHAATAFALPAAFNLTKSADVTNGLFVKNPGRPAEILNGADTTKSFQAISRRSAKTRKPDEVEFITAKIADLTDMIMLPLFDKLRPYAAHNQAMSETLASLNDPTSQSNPIQAKCRSLLFDGTGNRHVFEKNVDRLQEISKELRESGEVVPTHITSQLTYCDSVDRALRDHEETVKLKRSFLLFNIDVPNFQNRDKDVVEADLKELRARGKAIFDTMSTQAFQLGYLMAVLSHVEAILPVGVPYDQRLTATRFVSSLYLAGLNSFFAVTATKHRTMSGYVAETHARAFEASYPGFRGLLAATNVRELNEKQWEFFRYMITEIVHSKLASSAVREVLDNPVNAAQAELFRASLPDVLTEIEQLRNRYFEGAVRTALGTPEFKRSVELLQMTAKTEGKSEDDIKLAVDAEIAKKRTETIEVCKSHLRASLKKLETRAAALKRLASSATTTESEDDPESAEANLGEAEAEKTEIAVAVAADALQHSSDDDTSDT